MPHRGIIHVAGIDLLWRASRGSIADSVRSAIALAQDHCFAKLAMPVIGAGSGRYAEADALVVIGETLEAAESNLAVTVVRFRARELPQSVAESSNHLPR